MIDLSSPATRANDRFFILSNNYSGQLCGPTEDPSDCVNYEDSGEDSKESWEHPLDIKYPHKCYNCGDLILWKELLIENGVFRGSYKYIYTGKGYLDLFKKYKHLKKLWKSKVIQFYCCDCYYSVEDGF